MARFLWGFLSGILVTIVTAGLLIYFTAETMLDSLNSDGLDVPSLSLDSRKGFMPYTMELVDLRTGKTVTSKEWEDKIVVINFWENWCLPCRQEMPSLDSLRKKIPATNVVFAVISTQNEQKTRKENIVAKIDLPFYHIKTKVPPIFDGQQVPRTYIIGQSGLVVVSENGAHNWNHTSVIGFLDSLIHR